MKLPKAEQDLEDWQAAVETLLLVVELNGPTMMALFEGALRERHPTEDLHPFFGHDPCVPIPTQRRAAQIGIAERHDPAPTR